MKKKYFDKILVFLLLILCTSSFGQLPSFKTIDWEKEKIDKGLCWIHAQVPDLEGQPQNINTLVVNLKKRNIKLIYDPLKNIPTSKQASQSDAIAAVNAGFFDIRNGGSVTYIKIQGKIVDSDTVGKWLRSQRFNGAVLIDLDGNVQLDDAQSNQWYNSDTSYHDILVTGPFLLENGVKLELIHESFTTTKHPRTCIGIKNRNTLIFVTVDGRTEYSSGMSLSELTDLMISLKCKTALNLDGGGSTTMWIRTKSDNGIVNMPSDNRTFDHSGERSVSNIIVVN